ncbi:Uncharacterised protein [Bordetella ansorpii]|uniref:Uncharacterized protein n=1 Tax=Bordetella ansorpii TaxID=288768 RepID=A0A157NX20_9BORD|nr:hypothetical protein [Bordetella ansorpii]SAI25751.1 Uncharacterised protein [Bordetella ansorpii]
MQSKLIDHPACMTQVRHIYEEMVQDRFESLVAQGLAGPSSASEYRAALAECLAGQKMATISDADLAEGFVFVIPGNSQDKLSIEVPIFSHHGCSDAFAVFRLRSDESARVPVYLYDILVP